MDFRLNELDGEEDELNLNNSTNKGPSQVNNLIIN